MRFGLFVPDRSTKTRGRHEELDPALRLSNTVSHNSRVKSGESEHLRANPVSVDWRTGGVVAPKEAASQATTATDGKDERDVFFGASFRWRS